MARRPTSSPTRSRTAPRIISPAAMGEPAPRKDVRMAIVNDHTVKAFDEDLNRLRGLISEMGGRAEQALLQAMTALGNGDQELAVQVVQGDKKIDALEAEVEQLAVQTIALRAPMADDLRRSEERRVGQECVRTGRSGWPPYQ